ncbi:MAG TPA: hypothetical protein VNO23_01365 [Candidatus Binatia bacterium]|nr:hypothetical protein [Candidatus Binatia bacterium]
MNLDSRLQGQLAAAAIEALLADAGYQVIPVGIEHSLRELKFLDPKRYVKVAPVMLRTAPDLFVLDPDGDTSRLVEVKYRRRLHERLVRRLRRIQAGWAPFVLVLIVAESPPNWAGHINHIKAFEIDRKTHLSLDFLGGGGRRLQDVFPRLTERWADETILRVQDVIRRLSGWPE